MSEEKEKSEGEREKIEVLGTVVEGLRHTMFWTELDAHE